MAFAPGSAALTPEARQGLDKVAKALTDIVGQPVIDDNHPGAGYPDLEPDPFAVADADPAAQSLESAADP